MGEPAFEFSVAFECADRAEAERVVEAVVLAVCGGKRWKHRRPFRWLARWLPIDICPRSFGGSGPYELKEEGEARYDAGRRYFQAPGWFPKFWDSSLNSNSAQWAWSNDNTADAR